MKEIRREVRTVTVEATCDCFEGHMVPTGMALLTLPPKYPHRCNQCGKEEVLGQRYPYLDYEIV